MLAILLAWAVLTLPAAAEFPAVPRSSAPIVVTYPAEKAFLPQLTDEFIYGYVANPLAAFTINGQTVTVHSNGAYLAWLPVQPGTFTFTCKIEFSQETTSYQRTVFITPPPQPLPAQPLTIDQSSLWPASDLELRSGDWINIRLRATPGQTAQFRLPKRGWRPLVETNPALGIYEAAYWVGPQEELAPSPVEFRLGSGFSSVRAKSPGKVTLTSAQPTIAVVRGGAIIPIKAGLGAGQFVNAAGGTRLMVTGRMGNDARVALSPGISGYLETKNMDFLSGGVRPPRAFTDTIGLKSTDGATAVRIGLTERVPFSIDESEDLRSITIHLHNTLIHTNWIVYGAADDFVGEVRFKQESSDIAAVSIILNPGKTLWGTHAQFDGNSLRVELRHPPRLAPAPASALLGVKVFLDSGHTPSAPGENIGPLGTREMDLNFALTKAVESRLIRQGAKPLLSRNTNEDEALLADRPRWAWEKKADLFISIHNNNLSDGSNPFSAPHGYSTFYYHPHSLALAQELQRAYQQRVPFPDEKLRFGDLLVLRMTEMPAALTESAYLNLPEQEQEMLDPAFRGKVADAIVFGLRSFLEKERARQGRLQVVRVETPPAKNRVRKKK